MGRILKWLGIGIGALVVLALLAVAIGWFWLNGKIKSHMTLPDNNPEVSSLLEYREQVSAPKSAINLSYELDLTQPGALTHPPEERRPWTRWWWPGGDVSAETACAQLAAFDAKGFGGVEIQAFAAGLDIDSDEIQASIRSFGSDEFNAELSEVMACASDLNFDLYLNHLSGWPAGGPQVPVDEGLRELRFSEKTVSGGREVSFDLPAPKAGFGDHLMAYGEMAFSHASPGADLNNFVPELGQLVSVVAAKKIGGKRDGSPMVATDTVELDGATAIVLTDRVVDGRLSWDAPEGEWVIVAAWSQPSGSAPVLVAGDSSGFVVDHLDTEILSGHYAYAFGERTGLSAHYGEGFTGFFNDSIEFMADRLGTPDILEEFESRRGYDLEPLIPAVFVDVRDNFYVRDVARVYAAPSFKLTGNDERIRFDYQKTISDLLVDRFVGGSADWAEARGLLSKGQSYGMDLDAIQALGRNHIPEMEQLYGGGSEFSLKLAGAAGLLYDRPVIASESFVWSEMGYAVSPARIKAAADKLFLSGVNQILYHGVPYDSDRPEYAEAFGEMGWHPFHGNGGEFNYSGNYGPESSIWNTLEEINTYLVRSQNLLQAGKPDADVLIYYPFLGFPSELSISEQAKDLFLFMGAMPDEVDRADKEAGGSIPFVKLPEIEKLESTLWLERLMPIVKELDERGITWTWVNDDALTHRLDTLNTDQKILLFDAPWIELESAQALAAISDRVAIMGRAPTRQPGYLDHQVRDAQIADIMRVLEANRTLSDAGALQAWAKGNFVFAGASTVRRVTRVQSDDSAIHFLSNQSATATRVTVDVTLDEGSGLYAFDPKTGQAFKFEEASQGQVELAFPALASLFLIETPGELPGAVVYESLPIGEGISLTEWSLKAGTFEAELESPLVDAASLEAFRDEGTGLVYSTTTSVSEIPGPIYLVMERVEGSVAVSVNGSDLGRLVLPPYEIDISSALHAGENQITLTVTPPRFHELVARAESGEEPKMEFMAGLGEKKHPKIGLIGGVRLVTQSVPNP